MDFCFQIIFDRKFDKIEPKWFTIEIVPEYNFWPQDIDNNRLLEMIVFPLFDTFRTKLATNSQIK